MKDDNMQFRNLEILYSDGNIEYSIIKSVEDELNIHFPKLYVELMLNHNNVSLYNNCFKYNNLYSGREEISEIGFDGFSTKSYESSQDILRQYIYDDSVYGYTSTEGISRIKYEIPRLGRDGKPDGTYKEILSPKTVYDPNKFSDSMMLELGQKAAAKGYNNLIEKNKLDSRKYQDSQYINGIKFRYYIYSKDKGVTNVHPE